MATEPRRRFQRILITRMKFIGDIVLTTPVIRSVRNAYPDAFIAYLGDRDAVSLLAHHPCLNEIIPFDFSRPAIIEQPRVIRRLRGERFDCAIDLFGNPRSALLVRASGAPVRVGPARRWRGGLYTQQVEDDGRPKSAIEFHHQSLRALGIEPTSWRTELFLTEEERRLARLDCGAEVSGSGPLIALHAGATWPAKRWGTRQFGRLADMLAQQLGARVLLTGGPEDREIVGEVCDATASSISVAPVLPLRRLAALLSICDVVVSNDAGPMHIAAAVGTPTIGLFGPGEENIWFPYSAEEGHRALRRDVPCHPCHLDFCNRTGTGYMECMQLLTPEEVLAAVGFSLRGRRKGQRNHFWT